MQYLEALGQKGGAEHHHGLSAVLTKAGACALHAHADDRLRSSRDCESVAYGSPSSRMPVRRLAVRVGGVGVQSDRFALLGKANAKLELPS